MFTQMFTQFFSLFFAQMFTQIFTLIFHPDFHVDIIRGTGPPAKTGPISPILGQPQTGSELVPEPIPDRSYAVPPPPPPWQEDTPPLARAGCAS